MTKAIQYTITTIVAVLAGLLIFSTFRFPGNYRLYVVQSGSMEPEIPVGAVVAVRPVDQYQESDIITYRENGQTITHRVIGEENGRLVTKGDANEEADTQTVRQRDVLGKVLLDVPYLGYAVNSVRTPYGLFLLIILPATWIIYDEIRKIKSEVVAMRQKHLMILTVVAATAALLLNTTNAFFSDVELSTTNLFEAAAWEVWTTQADFEDLSADADEELDAVDTTTEPGSVLLSGAYSPDDNTVALWHLNEASGATEVTDASGNGHTGTASDTTITGKTGKWGKAVEFDGVDDYIEIPDDVGLDFTSTISVEAWIKLTDVTAGSQFPVSKGNAEPWNFQTSSDGSEFRFFVRRASDNSYANAGFSTALLTNGEWFHVAGTFNGTDIKIYLNGGLKETTPFTGMLKQTSNNVNIGAYNGTAGWVSGLIDEVRISSVARTEFPVDYFDTGGIAQVFDGSSKRRWLQLTWDEVELVDTDLSLEVATSTDGTTWTGWELLSSTSPIDLTSLTDPDSRYIKWRATLSNTDDTTPKLEEVTLFYASP